MFCTKCGAQIEDGSLFCVSCGAKIEGDAPAPAPVAETPVAPAEVPVAETPVAETPVVPVTETPVAPVEPVATPYAPVEGAPVANPNFAQPVAPQEPKAPKEKKPINKKVFIFGGIGLAAVLAIVAAIIIIVNVVANANKKPGYVYFADGTYYYVADAKDKNSMEIEEARLYSTASLTELVNYSKDGKYVYFFTKYDGYYTGTLNRIAVDKINDKNNDKYIEEIDNDVNYLYSIIDSGVVYKKNDTLCYYNGKDTEKIAKEVYSFETDGKTVVFTQGSSDSRNLYAVALNDLDNKEKLLGSISNYITNSNLNDFYAYRQDDDKCAVYKVGMGKDAEKLFTCESVLDISDGVVYYLKSDKTVSLYEYVNDTYATADAKVKEPDTSDYQVPVYNYKKADADYELLEGESFVATCTKPVYYVEDTGWWTYYKSIEWGAENDEDYASLYAAFVEKYKSSENEDGYFEVTDAVLKDIKTLAKKTGNASDWKKLLCVKYVYYYNTDWDAYYAARDAWYAADSRINIRNQLKSAENDKKILSLCSWKDGQETVIQSDLVNFRWINGALTLNTLDGVTERLNIEDISYVSEVSNLFGAKLSDKTKCFVFNTGKVLSISDKAADAMLEVQEKGYYPTLYFEGTKVVMTSGLYTISVAETTNDEIGKFEEVVDEARMCTVNATGFYYFEDIDEEGSYRYGDLCLYNFNGEKKTVAKNIYIGGVIVYEDGSMLGVKEVGSDSNYYGSIKADIYLYDTNGEETKIATDAYGICRVDKSTYLFLSDEDLYMYDGGKPTKVQNDVDAFWPAKQYGITDILSVISE